MSLEGTCTAPSARRSYVPSH